jgi:hypothetical protein
MMIFVFGSNEAGIHGAGAAKYARQYRGAFQGQGYGLSGRSFAIPTKDKHIRTLPLAEVATYIHKFLIYARQNPQLEFQITRIGCGLAGFSDNDIAPLFASAPDNCYFDNAWKTYLPSKKFWGSFDNLTQEALKK